jgi:acyl-CoA thioesterase-1
MALELTATTRLLFIGDSITDCGRREDPEKIGSGYPRLIRDYLRAAEPQSAPLVFNAGISGNCVTDLADRWQTDVLNFAPDVLSIKIGINDVWHNLAGQNGGVAPERFRTVYRNLLAQVGTLLPDCKLVLCEPSVIWPPQPMEGNALLAPYISVVNELAAEFEAECVVPLHAAFEDAKSARPDIEWAPDGVHPSSSGQMLIARTWLEATGLL